MDIRAAIYCRVSTKPQAGEEKISIPDQLRECRKYISREGWTVAGEYIDPGISANTVERPGLKRLLASMDGWDVVVAWDFDRFYRDKRSVAGFILDTLDENRKQITSTKQPIPIYDPSTFDPRQNDTPYMLREMAGFTSGIDNRRRFRTLQKGLKERVAQGYMIKPPPYGYRIVYTIENGKVKACPRGLIPEQTQIVKRIFGEYRNGKSCFALARQLNEERIPSKKNKAWSANVVRHIIMNPVYCGKVRTNFNPANKNGKRIENAQTTWRLFPGKHPPIITEAEWEDAQVIRKARNRKPRAIGSRSLLSGLVKCGHCGWAMVKVGGWGGGYFNCGNYHQTHNCCVNSYRRIHLEKEVVDHVLSMLRDERLFEKINRGQYDIELKRLKEEISALKTAIDEFPGRKRALFDLYERGHITMAEFHERKSEHDERLTELSSRTATKNSELQKFHSQQLSRELFQSAATHLQETFDRCDLAKKKQKLREIIEAIVIRDHSFKINFRLSTTAD